MAAVNVVFASPRVPPPAPTSEWDGCSLEWHGWDGSVWDLTKYAGGVFLQADGVEGLHEPAVTDWVSQSPAVHGQYYRGHVVDPRECFWPVHVYSERGSAEWLERDSRFWRSLLPGRYGTWKVTTPQGDSRTLTVRHAPTDSYSYGVDPVRNGWASYPVRLIADDPFWYGAKVRRPFANEAPVDFFGGDPIPDDDGVDAAGPDFHIMSGQTLAAATMTNDGDEEAWPVWTITGPFESVAVGVDGYTAEFVGSVGAGDLLVIDTDPQVQMAWLNGEDVTGQLVRDDFASIPVGEEVPLSLSMVGTGVVTAEIQPRFYRAFGVNR